MTAKPSILRRCLALLSLGIISACSTTPADQSARLVNSWQLTSWSLNGELVAPAKDAVAPTLTVQSDGAISGSASVNRYNAQAEFDADGGVAIPPRIMTTRRAGPPAAMEQERRYLAFLPTVRRYRFVGERLRLESDQGWAEFEVQQP